MKIDKQSGSFFAFSVGNLTFSQKYEIAHFQNGIVLEPHKLWDLLTEEMVQVGFSYRITQHDKLKGSHQWSLLSIHEGGKWSKFLRIIRQKGAGGVGFSC